MEEFFYKWEHNKIFLAKIKLSPSFKLIIKADEPNLISYPHYDDFIAFFIIIFKR